jgi:hypothetical protein
MSTFGSIPSSRTHRGKRHFFLPMGIKQWQKGHLPLTKIVNIIQRREKAIVDNTYKAWRVGKVKG